jgi:hypothetical protein
MLGVLHPWTRDMASHPHGHSLVPGGALSPDGSTWLAPHYAAWLVPVRALSILFRGKCKEALTKAALIEHVPPHVWHQAWVTHGKPAGTGKAVMTSLAPSIRRIAITNNRIDTREDGHVTCRFQDSASHAWRHKTLPAEACIRRFLQHVRPKGCTKVRYSGFLSPTCRATLSHIRHRLTTPSCPNQVLNDGDTREPPRPPPTPAKPRHCSSCGGQLVLVLHLSVTKRAPP